MSNIDLLKNIWKSIYDPKKDVGRVIKQYFHPNYTQCINGVEMSYDDYVIHVKEQKQNMQINTIDYEHMLENGDEVFALYYPRGTNNEGLLVEAEVIAYFRFEEQKLNRIHGQVRLIKGSLSDVDM